MFAAAGILIPIAVHLWNVRQGKILKVGSVALLEQQALKSSSSIKLNELLLLLLRCLLIILLAVLLAKPQWQAAGKTGEKGWLLIPRQGFGEIYKQYKPQADSLLAAGYALHYFEAGVAPQTIDNALTRQDGDSTANYWVTLSQLNKVLDANTPVYLFTSSRLAHFSGTRPAVNLSLHWFTTGVADTSAPYLVQAYKTYNDSINLITTAGSTTGMVNTYQRTAFGGLNGRGYKLVPVAGGVTLVDDKGITVNLDTAAQHITIYTGGNTSDAGYLKAAIDAVRQFTGRNITLTLTDDAAKLPPGQDWLFWLSPNPVPAHINAKNIFAYADGKEVNTPTWLLPQYNFAVGSNAIEVSKQLEVDKPASNQEALWRDGFGNVVLSKGEGPVNRYHFLGRFNPSWNGLAWSSRFPQLLLELLVPENNTAPEKDSRMIDTAQMQPIQPNDAAGEKHMAKPSVDVSNFLWLVAALIFLLERTVAHRNKKERVYAS